MPRVIVGMSGGVDSSVAAALLKSAGYDVIGVSIKLSDNTDITKAEYIAKQLRILHVTVDRSCLFRSKVIDYFKSEYMRGNTPNPCVICNRVAKFKTLYDVMLERNADFIATGHYANVHEARLFKGLDKQKDQSYFLYNINRDWLKHILFPLGDMLKEDVRKYASHVGLNFTKKEESSDVCFLNSTNGYRNFLGSPEKPGNIVDENGNILGRHNGFFNYTVGQRRGIGISSHEPMYVKSIDPERNVIVVSSKASLLVKTVKIKDVNLLSDVKSRVDGCNVKVRYSKSTIKADVDFSSDFSKAIIKFYSCNYDVAKGQSCVIYDSDMVIGGGIIEGYE